MHNLKPLNRAVAAVLLGGSAAGVFLGVGAFRMDACSARKRRRSSR